MQWLINTIMELIQPMLDALKVTIHGQLGFFNRGDPAAYDFGVGNFIADNTWRDLDLSSIVPAEAKEVLIRLRLKHTAIGRSIRLRTKGNVNNRNLSQAGTVVANAFHWYDIHVIPNSDRIVQYRLSPFPWTNIDLTIGGWWLR